jgi:hypothetical protein
VTPSRPISARFHRSGRESVSIASSSVRASSACSSDVLSRRCVCFRPAHRVGGVHGQDPGRTPSSRRACAAPPTAVSPWVWSSAGVGTQRTPPHAPAPPGRDSRSRARRQKPENCRAVKIEGREVPAAASSCGLAEVIVMPPTDQALRPGVGKRTVMRAGHSPPKLSSTGGELSPQQRQFVTHTAICSVMPNPPCCPRHREGKPKKLSDRRRRMAWEMLY